MTLISVAQLKAFAPACDFTTLAPLFDKEAARCNIDTNLRISHWLGQLHEESGGLTRLEESFAYSPLRLHAVFPRRVTSVAAAAALLAQGKEAVAERVYGNRPTLGNTTKGDGWRYHGRGFTQLTGRANYEAAKGWTGVDLVGNPELAAQPATACKIAADFWRVHDLNALADRDDVAKITEVVNGSTIGLDERRIQVGRAKTIWT